MKKKLALLLTGILLLTACGPSGETLPSEGGQETQSGQEAGDASGAEDGETAVQALPAVKIENIRLTRYAEDGDTQLVEISQDNMTLSGEGYEKAAEAVRRLLYTAESELSAQADDMMEMAAEHYESVKADAYWFSPYTSSSTYEIVRLDNRVLSVKRQSYEYSGGAHGMGVTWGTTIDLESGLALELPHLASDSSGFMDKMLEVVLESLSQRKEELFADYEAYVREDFEQVGWYLDASGIEVIFSPYEIGPYASGNISVCVPYGAVADYMKPEYCGLQEVCISRLPQNSQAELKLADGTCTVLLQYRTSEDGIDELACIINGEEFVSRENVWVKSAYLLQRTDGRAFLIYDIDWASDDYETFVCELSADGARETASVYAALDGSAVSQDSVVLNFSLYVLGTYASEMPYALTEEGELEPLGERFEITPNGEWQQLTTIRELPVTVNGQQTTLPAGTKLYIEATDNAGTAWFRTVESASGSGGDGVSGEISFERREDDYQLYIDGISEYEYFEDLPYAG